MKVTYEFNCEGETDDSYNIKVFQKAHEMLEALHAIQDYMRAIRKEHEEPTVDEMEDRISDMIIDSGIGEIE